jgi:hypothetical protein
MAFGTCDFSSVKKQGNSYLYSKECHDKVNKLQKETQLREEQVGELKKSIELKDLAIDKGLERVELWKESSYDLEDRLHKVRKYESYNSWVYFTLGVFVTGVAVYGAGQLK